MLATTLRSSDITFRAETHEYITPDGRSVPSVTTILRAVGVSVDFEALSASSSRIGAAIGLKRDIGTALHHDAWAYDDNDLEFATVDTRVQPYLESWIAFRANTGVTPTTRERRVLHPTFLYAGTLDGIFRTPAGQLVLIDIKTGDCNAAGTAYQTAAYLAAYLTEHPTEELIARWGVQLTPDHAVPYRISPYTAWDDFFKFQAFLTTYRCQADRRLRSAT